jgi:multidrug efflux pump subunit AcrB
MNDRRAARSATALLPVRYRVPAALVLAALVLLGLFAFVRLPAGFPPVPEALRLGVEVPVPGLTPAQIEEKIMRPLEAALHGTPGIARIDSLATPGQLAIELVLEHDTDAGAVQQEVAARLAHARAMLPAAVAAPVLSWHDDSRPAAVLTVTARDRDPLALRDWADSELGKRLSVLPGVAAVVSHGAAVRAILVRPDQRRLAGFGIGFGDIIQALQGQPDPPAQLAAPPTKPRHGRAILQPGNVAAVAAMPVRLPGGESIPLSELAEVTLVEQAAPGAAAAVVTLAVQPRARAVRADVYEQVRTELEWLRANRLIPADITVQWAARPADAAGIVRRLSVALFGGWLLALLAAYVLCGLRRARILAAITAAAAGSALVAMFLLSLTLNSMTLGALALAGGWLGASAILMFGRTGSAITLALAAILTLPLALAPLAFAGGEVQALFRGFVIVLGLAWIMAALLAAVTVPAFDTRQRHTPPWAVLGRQALRLWRSRYRRALGALLRRPWVLPLLVLAFVSVLTALFFLRQPDPQPAFRPAPGAALSWRLRGADGKRLAVLAEALARRLRAAPSLREVANSAQRMQEQYVLHLDAARASEFGLDLTDVGRALAIAIDGITAGSIRDGDRRYDIRVQLPSREAQDAIARGRLLLLGELKDRPAVYLRDVATVERAAVPAQIWHENGLPAIVVTAVAAPDAAPQRIASDIRRALASDALPPGYVLSGDGVADTSAGAVAHRRLPLLSLVLVCTALGVWRRSWRLALVVAAGTGAVAAVAAALLLRLPLPFSVWVGTTLAVGIAAFPIAAAALPLEALRRAGVLSRRALSRGAQQAAYALLVMMPVALAAMVPLAWLGATAGVLRPLVVITGVSLILGFLAGILFIPSLYFLLTPREQVAVRPHL